MDINKLIIKLAELNPSEEQLRKLFTKYNLTYLLPAIQKSSNKLIQKEKFANENRLLSPFILDEIVINKIEEKYKLKVDKREIKGEILAGYKLYTRDKVVDNTLSSIIKRINPTNAKAKA